MAIDKTKKLKKTSAPPVEDTYVQQAGNVSTTPRTQTPQADQPKPGYWVWPTSSTAITQQPSQTHMALDIGGSMGAPVVSPSAGRITAIKYQPQSYGYNVRVETPEGFTIVLAHLMSVVTSLVAGQQVTAGQLLGQLGSTGATSTGPHLHLEIRAPGYSADRFVPDTGAAIGSVDPREFFVHSTNAPTADMARSSTQTFTYAPSTSPGVSVPGGPVNLVSSTSQAASTGGSVAATVKKSTTVGVTPEGYKIASSTVLGKEVGAVVIPKPGVEFTRWALVGIGVILVIAAMVMMVSRYSKASGAAIEKVVNVAAKAKKVGA